MQAFFTGFSYPYSIDPYDPWRGFGSTHRGASERAGPIEAWSAGLNAAKAPVTQIRHAYALGGEPWVELPDRELGEVIAEVPCGPRLFLLEVGDIYSMVTWAFTLVSRARVGELPGRGGDQDGDTSQPSMEDA